MTNVYKPTVYQFFHDPGSMSDTRRRCYEESLGIFGVPVTLVTAESLFDYEIKENPIHRAYHLLSPVHKSDYARCYLLRFHGGGYADIKKYGADNNWREQFDLLWNTPYADIVGQPENERWAAFDSYRDQYHVDSLIICGYMIAKKNTPFTRAWYDCLSRYLDFIFPALEKNPASDGKPNQGYPIPYFGIMGFPFHYTCFTMSKVRSNAVLRSLRSGRLQEPYR